MSGTDTKEKWFRDLVESYLGPVYNFAFRMSLENKRAAQLSELAYLKALAQFENAPQAEKKVLPWLIALTNEVLAEVMPKTPLVSFDLLDEKLRSDVTRTDVVRSLEPKERDVLLWELKQGCMTSVVNCLSAGERSAFVLKNVIALEDDRAAVALGITESAYRVRLSRATKKIADYLAPRCEHVDPLNPCRCPARVGVALANGFIGGGRSVSLRKPVAFGRYGVGADKEDLPLREVEAIYANLPDPEPAADLASTIIAKCIVSI